MKNQKANKILREAYIDKGIMYCEMCGTTSGLHFHHRHSRYWYKKKPELLAEFNQTLLLDIPCHNKVEHNRELHEEYFNKLRGEELSPIDIPF